MDKKFKYNTIKMNLKKKYKMRKVLYIGYKSILYE